MNIAALRGPMGQKDKLTPKEIAQGKIHMGFVKRMPCVICNKPGPSDVHHCIHRQEDGEDFYRQEPCGGRRSSDLDTIPLCKEHHQDGPEAIHYGKKSWREKHGPDYRYIRMVRQMVLTMQSDEYLGEWL